MPPKWPLLVILIVIVGGYSVFKNADFGKGLSVSSFLERIQNNDPQKELKKLLEQKKELEKMMEMTSALSLDKTNQTTSKMKEIRDSLEETKSSYEETLRAIEKLQQSLNKNREVLGIPEIKDEKMPSSTP